MKRSKRWLAIMLSGILTATAAPISVSAAEFEPMETGAEEPNILEEKGNEETEEATREEEKMTDGQSAAEDQTTDEQSVAEDETTDGQSAAEDQITDGQPAAEKEQSQSKTLEYDSSAEKSSEDKAETADTQIGEQPDETGETIDPSDEQSAADAEMAEPSEDESSGTDFYDYYGTEKTVIYSEDSGTATITYEETTPVISAFALSETELIQLAAPENVLWREDLPGGMNWSVNGDCQNTFRINMYDSEGNQIRSSRHSWSSSVEKTDFSTWGYLDDLADEKDGTSGWETGDYYFTVQALGDNVTYSDSEVVTSNILHYVKPSETLKPVTISISGNVFSWNASEHAHGYSSALYYSKTEDGEPQMECGDSMEEMFETDLDHYWEDLEDGYYYIKVCAVSEDIMQYNSVWSELVGPIHYQATAVVTDSLSQINSNSSASAEAIRSSVQEIGTTNLYNAMRADYDKSDGGVIDLMNQLESKTGVTTAVSVDDSLTFNADDISIVGSALNDLDEGISQITLNVSALSGNTNLIIPEQYQNTLSTSFSMDLEGVSNTEALKVPVMITMPIPDNINPDYLVILHYHQDGTYEVLEWEDLGIFKGNDGKYYVSFVLTSFSDFVMTMTNTGTDPGNSGNINPPGNTTGSGSSNTSAGANTTPEKTESSKPEQTSLVGTKVTKNSIVYLVTASGTVSVSKPSKKSVTKATIPTKISIDGKSFKVTAIADSAFSGCTKLTSISIGSNVKTIGKKAFYGCTKLQKVTGCASVTSVGSKAFYKCTKLIQIGSTSKAVTLKKVKTIGSSAFYGCKAIKKVNITSTALTSISASAFQSCTAMTSFKASSTKLASIGSKAFYGDKKLASVTFKTTKLTRSKVGSSTFKGIKSTCTFKVPSKKVSSYKTIFKAKGAGSKIKVSK